MGKGTERLSRNVENIAKSHDIESLFLQVSGQHGKQRGKGTCARSPTEGLLTPHQGLPLVPPAARSTLSWATSSLLLWQDPHPDRGPTSQCSSQGYFQTTLFCKETLIAPLTQPLCATRGTLGVSLDPSSPTQPITSPPQFSPQLHLLPGRPSLCLSFFPC